jgi:hypothetical protein
MLGRLNVADTRAIHRPFIDRGGKLTRVNSNASARPIRRTRPASRARSAPALTEGRAEGDAPLFEAQRARNHSAAERRPTDTDARPERGGSRDVLAAQKLRSLWEVPGARHAARAPWRFRLAPSASSSSVATFRSDNAFQYSPGIESRSAQRCGVV